MAAAFKHMCNSHSDRAAGSPPLHNEILVTIPFLPLQRANLHRRAGHASVADSDAALISDRTILAAAGVAGTFLARLCQLKVRAAPCSSSLLEHLSGLVV
jgi:hypothetical protein